MLNPAASLIGSSLARRDVCGFCGEGMPEAAKGNNFPVRKECLSRQKLFLTSTALFCYDLAIVPVYVDYPR
jgi:hypothetical protein